MLGLCPCRPERQRESRPTSQTAIQEIPQPKSSQWVTIYQELNKPYKRNGKKNEQKDLWATSSDKPRWNKEMANISLEEKRRGSNTSPTKNRPQQITSWIYRACNDLKKDPPECRQCKQPLLIKHLSTTCPEYMPSRNLYLKDLTIREILSENQNFNFTNLVKFLRSTKIFEEILIKTLPTRG